MTMPNSATVPPRTAERLLDALGATPAFRDALLGDLAEEHALRVAYDGERAAGRWYWREAFRVAPHLRRDWAHQLRARDVAQMGGAVGAGFIGVGAVVMGTLAAVETAVERSLGPVTFPWHDERSGMPTFAAMLLLYVVLGAVAGRVASRLEHRAPAVAALGVGIAWAAFALALPLPARSPLPAWYLLAQAVAVLGGTVLGGLHRIARRPCPPARA